MKTVGFAPTSDVGRAAEPVIIVGCFLVVQPLIGLITALTYLSLRAKAEATAAEAPDGVAGEPVTPQGEGESR